MIQIDDADSAFLEKLLLDQQENGRIYPVDEAKYRKFVKQIVKRADKVVAVTVPEEDSAEEEPAQPVQRDSIKIQALLTRIGETMGFRIWLPRNDRSRVEHEWQPEGGSLLESLPLNYDETTLKTIENIVVLWLRGRSIVRVVQCGHSRSNIPQPSIPACFGWRTCSPSSPTWTLSYTSVAPDERRDKVFEEIQRPVFSLLDKGPLSELCTFLSYDSISELSTLKHLAHVTDSILEEYAEVPE